VRTLKGAAPGDFDVAFDVRHKSLPDLVVSNIGLRRLDDGRDTVCVTYGNVGPEPVGTFGGSLKVDGVAIPSGYLRWPRMAVDESRDFCVVDGLPLGRHTVSFDVDADRNVPEANETNNHIEQLMTITSAASSDSAANTAGTQPAGNPPPAEASLSVSAIRLQGANGTECNAGQHRVIVAVKNDDDAAVDVTVRLIVDDDLDTTREQTGLRLEAKRTRDVAFDGVVLDEGERALTARALTMSPSTEANEGDNRRRITLRCDD
jgi:subtilase family serine protease